MKPISPLAYLLEPPLLQLLLKKADKGNRKALLEYGVMLIGLDKSIISKAVENDTINEAILHISLSFKDDKDHQHKFIEASLGNELNTAAWLNVRHPDTTTTAECRAKKATETATKSYKKNKKSSSIKASTLHLKPNIQQENILNNCSKGIQVEAFAGAGKSTTCNLIINELGIENSLYTAFLSRNVEEARAKITTNAYTQDSLATRFILKQSKFEPIFNYNPTGNIPSSEMKNVLGLDQYLDIGSKKTNLLGVAKLIHQTVNNYCNSAENQFTIDHVSVQVINPTAQKKIHRWSVDYWNYLISGNADSPHYLTYNHLMKYWSLTPGITIPDNFKNIVIDEAQDISGAFYRVMKNHSDRNLIVVGDRYQELFKWRGAINSMDKFDKDSYPLEESYRFGTAIAEGSNKILSRHSIPPKHSLIGQKSIDSRIIFYNDSEKLPHCSGAILTRTRSCVISIADTEIKNGNSVHIKTEFGPLKYILKNILHFSHKEFDKVNHPYLVRCPSFSSIGDELINNPDADIYFGLKLYEKYKDNVINVIENLEKNNIPEKDALKIISTTHSIKGQEWDNVIISPDYAYIFEKENIDMDSELSVLYVALTRARS